MVSLEDIVHLFKETGFLFVEKILYTERYLPKLKTFAFEATATIKNVKPFQ